MRPIEPQAWPMVCLNQRTGSSGPFLAYGDLEESSAMRLAFQAGVRGIMTRSARAGRGIRESRVESVRE